MNSVCLLGRLTADPEMRQTPNGTAVCSFSVAVNRNFKNRNGEYQADFINCVAWRQTAEFITRYFKKRKYDRAVRLHTDQTIPGQGHRQKSHGL